MLKKILVTLASLLVLTPAAIAGPEFSVPIDTGTHRATQNIVGYTYYRDVIGPSGIVKIFIDGIEGTAIFGSSVTVDILLGSSLTISGQADIYSLDLDYLTLNNDLNSDHDILGDNVRAKSTLAVRDITSNFFSGFVLNDVLDHNIIYSLPASTNSFSCFRTEADGVTLDLIPCASLSEYNIFLTSNTFQDIYVSSLTVTHKSTLGEVEATDLSVSSLTIHNILSIADENNTYFSNFVGGLQTTDLTYTLPTSTGSEKCFKSQADGVTLEWADCGSGSVDPTIDNIWWKTNTFHDAVVVSSPTVMSDALVPFDQYVKSLLHFNNNITDEIGKTWSGTPSYDASGKFSQALTASPITTSTDLTDFDCSGGEDCTIDFWFKSTETDSYGADIFSLSTGGGRWFIYHGGVGSSVYSMCYGVSGSYQECTPSNIPVLEWHHFAFVQTGGKIRIYVDGVNASVATKTMLAPGATVDIMDASNSSIDEFRFSKGVARWTTTFTPPTTPYSATDPMTSGEGFLTVVSDSKPYTLFIGSAPYTSQVEVSSTTGVLHARFGAIIKGKTDFGALTHAELQTITCPTLPCTAMSSDSPYHIYIATGTGIGDWQDELGSGPY